MSTTIVQMDEMTLLTAARLGEEEAWRQLIQQYEPLLKKYIHSYFLVGGDKEDLYQEGLIGLCHAIRTYDEQQARFSTYAQLCVKRQMINAIRKDTRQKHQVLNTSVSFESDRMITLTKHSAPLSEVLEDPTSPIPEEAMVKRECYHLILSFMEKLLSPFERRVFLYYADGLSYEKIAQLLQRPEKSIDNALQRSKRKLLVRIHQYFEESE